MKGDSSSINQDVNKYEGKPFPCSASVNKIQVVRSLYIFSALFLHTGRIRE